MYPINKQFYQEFEKWLDEVESLEEQEQDEWNQYIHEIYNEEKEND